jgi:TolB-like protein/DNA-binding winged helix-turn-helix (wHTH) protein
MPPRLFHFDEYTLDCARFELLRSGRRVKLEKLPMELLILLVERGGELVTRQEIVERLWGQGVYVDTEHGINTAIRKIRAALREDVERPRFLQTVSGKGYRFVREVKNVEVVQSAPGHETGAETPSGTSLIAPAPNQRRIWHIVAFSALALFLIAGIAFGLDAGGVRDRVFTRHRIGPIHSIAVLPLVNLSGDASQDYFADGLTDELITALARNRSLRVISRTSAMQYKGVNRPMPEIAQTLGVDGILEGSVSRAGNRFHVNLQLIYAPTDTHVWAQSYDRDLAATMALPDELSQTIAAEAKVDPTLAKTQRQINPEAHDAYLHGRYFWFAENGDRGTEYFEKAVQLQPDYAAAWDGLGDAYGERAVAGEIPAQEGFAKAEECTRKALQLDDSLSESHSSMAALNLFNKWDWHQAEAESLRAIELNPNYAEARFIHSYILLVTNREDEALKEQKLSSNISPFERPWGLGFLYIHMRQYEAAIDELKARTNAVEQNAIARSLLSDAYWLKGMWKESEEQLERAYVQVGDAKTAQAAHRAFEQGGEKAVAQLKVHMILAQARKQYVPSYSVARQYALLGDKEETLRFLQAAYRERSPWMPFIQKEPAFDFLHSDGRYRDLVRKIDLQPAY